MTILTVLRFPDPRLRTKAQPVTEITEATAIIIDDMLATMYQEKGVGLAATQVDIHQRIVVMDTSEESNTPIVLINPEIIAQSDEKLINEEGCLSVPGTYAKVDRHEACIVKALSEAEIPVVTPLPRKSTDTVNAVSIGSVLLCTIIPNSNSLQRFSVKGAQINPRP